MFSSKWIWRLFFSIFLSLICLFVSFSQTDYLLNYMNLTFLLGLFLLIISASTFVISSGFFNLFIKGFATLIKKDDDPYSDKDHWSYEKDNNYYLQKEQRRKISLEILLYTPITASIVLIVQSLTLLYYL